MKTIFLSAALLALLPFTAAAAGEADFAKQLDKILRHPGDYGQICDAMPWPKEAPIPAFHTIMHGEAGISDKNRELLKKNRAPAIAALRAKLKGLDPVKPAKPQKPDPAIPKDQQDVTPVGVDPAVYSDLLLVITDELNAIEAFPELVAFEAKYHAALAKAETDPKAPVPTSDGADGAGVHAARTEEELNAEPRDRTPAQEAEQERGHQLFRARMAHRDMLSVLVRVMRRTGYEPMLKSDIEKQYGKLLKERWGSDPDFTKYKNRDSIPEDERESVKWDAIHQMAYPAWTSLQFPYSPAVRTQIVDLARGCAAAKTKP